MDSTTTTSIDEASQLLAHTMKTDAYKGTVDDLETGAETHDAEASEASEAMEAMSMAPTPPPVPDKRSRTAHTVSAAAAAAYADAGYAPAVGTTLRMGKHLSGTEGRDAFAEHLYAFGADCAARMSVGIAVVSIAEVVREAWLFDVVDGDGAYVRLPVDDDGGETASSLLLRQVDLAEDYLATHAHGSAVGIDPTEGVSGIRLPDAGDVPREKLATTEEEEEGE